MFDRQIKERGRTQEAVEETLRICRDQNVLREYLAAEEVANIMFTLLDEQKAKRFWEEEIRQEGVAIGEAKGEDRLSNLMNRLKGLGRIDDAFRAASDKAYRQQMYKELNI